MVVHVIEAGEGVGLGKKLNAELRFLSASVAGRMKFNPQTDKTVVWTNPGPDPVLLCGVEFFDGSTASPVRVSEVKFPQLLRPGESITLNF